MGRFGKFIKDASRRRVFANAALYVVAAWVAIQVAGMAIDAGLLRLALRDVFVAAFLGFPAALVISWLYDFTRRGLVRTPSVGADASFDRSLRPRDYLLFASLAAVWAMAGIWNTRNCAIATMPIISITVLNPANQSYVRSICSLPKGMLP